MPDKKYVLTVTVNPALDKTMLVRGFQARKEYVTDQEILTAGGKGLEVSRILKGLGVPTVATGLLGGWTGEKIKTLLNEENVGNNFYAISGESRINLTVVDPGKKNTRILHAGPTVAAQEIQGFVRHYERLLPRASSVVVTGRNVRGAKASLYADLIRAANKKNIPVVLDAAGPELLLGVRALPYLLKINRSEAETALKWKLSNLAKLKKALAAFHQFGARNVIISLGREGAVASSGASMWHIQSPKVNAKNDVGCGDAMIAGFLSGLLNSQPFIDCARWAAACGTANAMSMTPGQLNSKDCFRVLRAITTKAI